MRRLALLALVLLLPAASATGAGRGAGPEVHELTAAELPEIRTPAAAAATWCGAATERDQTPNVVAGHTVHWLYVTPLNELDRFSTLASLMQTDAEAIDAWWRREDAARTLRNDLTQLTCGAQLDLTSRRFQVPGSQFLGDFGFGQIFGQLEGDGFDSPFTKYVVYYDGPVPVSELDVCGRGGGDDGGIGLAVVYVRACTGVSAAAVVAHEILHTLGAVPDAAPNACNGHVCGDPSDLMNPNIGGEPLEAKVLDAGRDDYYGHSRSFSDMQDAPWLVQLDRQRQLRLNVAGPGRVVADVPGLECARSCTTTWNADTRLSLAATPTAGSKLVRWSGACSGGGDLRLHGRLGDDRRRPLRSPRLQARGRRRGTRSGPGAERDRLSAALLRVAPVVRPGASHGEAREGVEAPAVDRCVPGEEAHVHGPDDQGDERSRGLRKGPESHAVDARKARSHQVASFAWRRSTTSSSSVPAAPECAPRSRLSTPVRTSR